jgi:hypothetical protein
LAMVVVAVEGEGGPLTRVAHVSTSRTEVNDPRLMPRQAQRERSDGWPAARTVQVRNNSRNMKSIDNNTYIHEYKKEQKIRNTTMCDGTGIAGVPCCVREVRQRSVWGGCATTFGGGIAGKPMKSRRDGGR